MATNRVLYPSQTIFVNTSYATGAQASGSMHQLFGIQSFNLDFSTSLEDVNELGQQGPISRESLNPTQVNFGFNYLVRNLRNESGMGMSTLGSVPIFSDLITGLIKERNYYIMEATNNQEVDLITGDCSVLSVGNCIPASYSVEGSVGQFPTASVSFQALNARFSTTKINFDSPAVIPDSGIDVGLFVHLPSATTGIVGQLAVLKPGDIVVNINSAGVGVNNLLAQSYNISADLNLEQQQSLNSAFGTREITPPFNATASFEFIRKDLGTGNVNALRCLNGPYTVTVTLRRPSCTSTPGSTQVLYTLKNAVLESQSFSSSIGPASPVSMTFTASAGGPNSVDKGLFISGSLI
jgi:hypothetical protein